MKRYPQRNKPPQKTPQQFMCDISDSGAKHTHKEITPWESAKLISGRITWGITVPQLIRVQGKVEEDTSSKHHHNTSNIPDMFSCLPMCPLPEEKNLEIRSY